MSDTIYGIEANMSGPSMENVSGEIQPASDVYEPVSASASAVGSGGASDAGWGGVSCTRAASASNVGTATASDPLVANLSDSISAHASDEVGRAFTNCI